MVIYEDMYLGRAFEDMCAQMCVRELLYSLGGQLQRAAGAALAPSV